jgi:tetratricopeptide (TPR) repeat protein
MDKKRKPTPVAVYLFAKKPRGPARTQTIPEIRTVVMEAVEEPTISVKTKTPKRQVEERPSAEVTSGLNRLAELGHSLFVEGKLPEAKVIFEGLVASRPRDAFVHTMLGTIFLAQGAFDRALALFEVSLTLQPSDVAAMVYRGEIRFKQRRLKAALQDFRRAIELGAEGDPFVQRARKLLRMGRRLLRPKAE